MSGYGSDGDFTTWLSGQGLSLPSSGVVAAVLRQVGSDYVDAAYEHRLQCSRRAGGYTQERAWPRVGHMFIGTSLPDDLVPLAWISASYRAAYLESLTPGWATGSSSPNRITKREKVDTIEREFFASAEADGSMSAPGMAADAIINGMVLPWLCSLTRRADSLFKVI